MHTTTTFRYASSDWQSRKLVLFVRKQDCLALGAIFATTDSVAVLQVLEQDRAPLLFNMVFGEGVINDATTVALLRTVQVCANNCNLHRCLG